MKKHFIILLITQVVMVFMSCTHTPDYNTDSYANAQNKKLGRGVNIIGYDAIWTDSAKGRMKDKHFKLIKEAGFNNVRLVIMPFKFAMDSTSFTIDPKFYITLDWAIQQALACGLMVIVDFHEHNAFEKDPNGLKPMFLSMWKQIAEHCKNYSNEVLFEIANEPNMEPELWNNISMEAYSVLRKSNPDRTIVWGPVFGNQIKFLKDLKLPETDRNIIVAIHYYLPIQFTHQGAPWSIEAKDKSGITWTNTPDEEQAIISDFTIAQEWSEKFQRPLTLGEFGAYEKADMDSRVRWTNFVARQAEARSWSWSYWQFDSDFIVYNIDKEEWVVPIINALIPKTN
jgi:endoglucanase